MALQLYNTLTRNKERFEPIDPTNVRMYVCGPTVYDLAHIGNARPIIVFDVLFRLLRHIYGPDHVTYARNITDVDDKINNRAVERFPDMEPTAAIRRLTEETAAQFHKDIAALGVLPPTVEPRATEHIAQMRELCEALVANGHAYVSHDHVLFDASSMADYGRLANRSLEEMEAGARVDVAPYKKGAMDFVLWKPSTPAQPGWPSPCGIATPGRPGWHIECSAMADRWLWAEPKLKGLLSEAGLAHPHVFDIHGGGIDLVFPHHENELAQSRCAHGTPVMANYWMHNGFLQVEGEKMSKSLGNFVTINELLETETFGGRRWPGEVLRLAMLMTHYRQPIDFSVRGLEVAQKTLDNWYRAVGDVDAAETSDFASGVDLALRADLNTPEAISKLFVAYDVARDHEEPEAASRFKKAANLLGLLEGTESAWKERRTAGVEVDTARVQASIAARLEARKRKDFKESDRIRDELAAMGIQLKDSKNKETGEIETTWEVKR
ncbi:MAG: cysteine--tRNA ligase [Hyphomicrobiaceae bacterium]